MLLYIKNKEFGCEAHATTQEQHSCHSTRWLRMWDIAFGQVNRRFHYAIVMDCYKYICFNFCQWAFAVADVGFGFPVAGRLTPSPSTPERRASYLRRNPLQTARYGRAEHNIQVWRAYRRTWVSGVVTWCTLKANRTTWSTSSSSSGPTCMASSSEETLLRYFIASFTDCNFICILRFSLSSKCHLCFRK